MKQPAGATLTTTTSSASGYADDRDEMIPREQQHTQVVSSSEIVRRREEARRQAAAKLKEAKQEKARRLRALEPRVSPCLAPTCPHALCSASPVVHMVPILPISTTIVHAFRCPLPTGPAVLNDTFWLLNQNCCCPHRLYRTQCERLCHAGRRNDSRLGVEANASPLAWVVSSNLG